MCVLGREWGGGGQGMGRGWEENMRIGKAGTRRELRQDSLFRSANASQESEVRTASLGQPEQAHPQLF